ncbi:TlpA family protein disulfide reductase [Algoriphagus yeomjeoni]|uniref:TlpA family protein disulfide reductase n=1 Tax=Algoriphagus yeomjeoni TaxID=291403 RepID=UPI003CE58F26
MKKLIQLCFLASLCLYGSTLKAQSKVADSPPDKDLVYQSGFPGQESFRSSASLGEATPVVVYVETKRIESVDSMLFQLWDPYLNENDLPLPEVAQLNLSQGTMYDGSRATMRGQWESKPISGYGRLSLRFNKFTYLDRFLVEPGDSVRIRLDFVNARMLFSGPAAKKFRVQYELANAYENYRYDQNPTMFTGDSDYWGYSTEDSLSILNIKNQQSSIRRKMEFVSPGPVGLSHLENIFSMDISSHPGFDILDFYQGKVGEDFLEILRADLIGRLHFDQVFKFSTYYMEDSSHREFFQEKILGKNIPIPAAAKYSAYFPEYIYQKLAIESALSKEPFRHLLGHLPQEVLDQVYAIYIIKNYRLFKNSNRQFELALDQIQTPWVKEEINRLYSAQGIGQTISEIPLVDRQGNEISLNSLQGKTLLISFWLPGCQFSSNAYQSLIKPTEQYFTEDEDIEFVYISHDRLPERWNNNIESGNYSTEESLNLNAPGPPHPFMEYYNIRYFPTFMVVDKDGTVQNIGNIPDSSEELIHYLESINAESKPNQSK